MTSIEWTIKENKDKLDFTIICIKCYAVKGTIKKVKMDHRMKKNILKFYVIKNFYVEFGKNIITIP